MVFEELKSLKRDERAKKHGDDAINTTIDWIRMIHVDVWCVRSESQRV